MGGKRWNGGGRGKSQRPQTFGQVLYVAGILHQSFSHSIDELSQQLTSYKAGNFQA
jgi:hypothetical protein